MSNTHSLGERIAEKVKAMAKSKGLDPAQQIQKYIQERLCARLWAFEEGRLLTLRVAVRTTSPPNFSTSTVQPQTSMSIHTR